MLTHDMPNIVESYDAAQVKGQPRIYFFNYTPSCGIAFCVGTAGRVLFREDLYDNGTRTVYI